MRRSRARNLPTTGNAWLVRLEPFLVLPTPALALPDCQTHELWGNPCHQKYSTLPKFGNGVCVAATRPKEEGRIAIVTNAGRAAVDVSHIGANGFAGRATVSEGLAHTTGVIGVRRNRVVLTPGVCASSVCGDVVA